MHVLIIPSERFVSAEEPLAGIFQRDQARALKKAGLKVGILAPTPRSLRWLMVRSRGWARGFEIKVDDGISVYCYQSWRWVPGRVPYLSIIQPIIIGKRLFIRYISDHGNQGQAFKDLFPSTRNLKKPQAGPVREIGKEIQCSENMEPDALSLWRGNSPESMQIPFWKLSRSFWKANLAKPLLSIRAKNLPDTRK